METLTKKKDTFLYKNLISDQLWNRLTGRIIEKEEVNEEEAEQIMDAALGFLKLCADHPGNRFSPSEKVDIGWHTFLMYTKAYKAFCERYAERFIHHEPNDLSTENSASGGLAKTIKFMLEKDIAFDPAMWMGGINIDLSSMSEENIEKQLEKVLASSPCYDRCNEGSDPPCISDDDDD